MKELFLLDADVVYLNHGSFGLCPRTVFERYLDEFRIEIPGMAPRRDDLLRISIGSIRNGRTSSAYSTPSRNSSRTSRSPA